MGVRSHVETARLRIHRIDDFTQIHHFFELHVHGLGDAVQVAYAIGVADPVSIMVNDFGTSTVGPEVLAKAVRQVWNLKPKAIVEQFDLLKPRYKATAAYGHFGRTGPEFTWEKLDKVEELKDVVKTLR